MIGQRIKELRRARRISRADLAESLSISERSLVAYEQEARSVPIELLTPLADYFSVTTDYLIGRTDTPTEEMPIPTPSTIAAHETEGMPPVTAEEMQEVIKKAYLLIMQEEMKKKE